MLSEYQIKRRDVQLGLKAKEEKKAAKKIPIHTVKRMAEERLYAKKRKEYLEAHPNCEVKGCIHFSEQLHHKAGRVGRMLYNEKYFLAVCSVHHRIIEDNPKFAKEKGYSVSRLKNNYV